MNIKILLVACSLLICVLNVGSTQAAVMSMQAAPNNLNNSTTNTNGSRGGGIISKIADGKIEINAVTYSFAPSQAKVYDLNGQRNYHAEIKVGMFVNFLLSSNKARITELRLLRQ